MSIRPHIDRLTRDQALVGIFFSLAENQRFLREPPEDFEKLTFSEKAEHIAWKASKLKDLQTHDLLDILADLQIRK